MTKKKNKKFFLWWNNDRPTADSLSMIPCVSLTETRVLGNMKERVKEMRVFGCRLNFWNNVASNNNNGATATNASSAASVASSHATSIPGTAQPASIISSIVASPMKEKGGGMFIFILFFFLFHCLFLCICFTLFYI